MSAAVEYQLALYYQHLLTVKTNKKTGEVSNGAASDFTFDFGNGSKLTVQMMERLEIAVDGVVITNQDQPFIKNGPQAADVVEDGDSDANDATAQSASGAIEFFDLDLGDSHVVSVAGPAGPYGALVANVSNTTLGDSQGTVAWSYELNNAAVQFLAVGEQLTEVFTVRIADANNPANFAETQVTITITGTNDAPTLAAGSLAATEDGSAVSLDLSVLGDDVDSDNTGSDLTYTLLNATGGGTGSISGTTLSFNPGSDFQPLAVGETTEVELEVEAKDAHGATAVNTITVTVTGVNDIPTVLDVAVAATEDGGAVTAAFNGDDIDNDDDGSTLTYNIVGAPSIGTITNNGNSTFTFNPGANFQSLALGETATMALSYTATDTHGAVSAPGALGITVTGANDAPTLASGTLAAMEDGPVVTLNLAPLGNDIDSDDDGTTLTYAVVNSLPGGSASISGTTLSFDPGSDFQNLGVGKSTSFDLQVTATDAHGAVANNTVTVTVNGVNDNPDAVNDSASLTVLAAPAPSTQVYWVDWTSASIASTTPGRDSVYNVTGTITLPNKTIGVTYHGQLTGYQLAGGTDFYVTKNGGFGGPVSSTEGAGVYTSGEVANGPNNNDILRLYHADSARTLTFSEPVDNLFFAIVSMNANGYLFDQDFRIVSSADSASDSGYWGWTDSYTKIDLGDGRFGISTPETGNNEFHGVLAIDNAVKSLTWTSQSHENWNGFTIATYGSASTATASGNVLGNDTDIDIGDTLTVVAANSQTFVGNSVTLNLASGATVNVNKDGSYLYDENGAFTYLGQDEQADDSFTYTISDGNGGTDTATVTINVTGINDAPVITGGDTAGAVTVASSQGRFTVEQWTNYSASTSLASLQSFASSNPANYTVTTNVIDFTDDPAGFSGEIPGSTSWPAAVATGASGKEGINNNFFARVTASVLITQPDTYTFRTYNDDGVYLSVNGSSIISDSGYHPEAAFEGSIALTPGVYPLELYFFEGGGEASLELTFKNSSGIYQHVTSAEVHDSGSLQFTDVDLIDSHTVSVAPVGSVFGSLTATKASDTTGTGTGGNVNWDYSVGVLDYQYLGAGVTAVESFIVSVDDGKGGTDQQKVDITITGVNDAPVANADSATVNEDSSVSISVLANDTDPDVGDTKSIQSVANGQNGTVSISGSNVVYTPAANFFGEDSFSYVMRDAAGLTSTATVSVTVNPVNDEPTISFQAPSLANGSFEQAGSGTPLANWNVYLGDIDRVGVATWNPGDGDYSLDMHGFTRGGIQQTLATFSGMTYVVEFLLGKNHDGQGTITTATLRASVGSTFDDYIFADATAEGSIPWRSEAFVFTATGTASVLGFESQFPTTGAKGPALDDVRIAVGAKANVASTIKGLSVADIDSGNNDILLSLSVHNGTLDLSNVANLTPIDSDGSDGIIAYSGTLAEINAALQSGVIYTSYDEFDGVDTLTAEIDDLGATGGGSLIDTVSVDIRVIGVPEVELPS